MFALTQYLYGKEKAGGAEEVAYTFVGISGGVSALLARGHISFFNLGQRIPIMWPVLASFVMAAWVCKLEIDADPANGHTIALTMFTHTSGIVEMIAKVRAGGSPDD